MTVVQLTDNLLSRVDKPARYIGGELNSASKTITPDLTRVAFCFPDVYEVGMSHLGMQILYHFFNRREDVFCERCSHLGQIWKLKCVKIKSHFLG